MTPPQRAGRTVLRVAVASLLIVHSIARIWLGIVDDFGGFLAFKGFPLPEALAWLITVGELMCGSALALGRFVPLCAGFHAAVLAGGIAMVHASQGWFVVGAGRNGVEYSVLLIAALAAIVLLHHEPAGQHTSAHTQD